MAAAARRWELALGPPLEHDGFNAYVAHARMPGGADATLKVGYPHLEGRDEIAGLRLLGGDPTVRLLAADEATNAMLLERCVPGTPLRHRPAAEQDEVIARTLRRAWRPPPAHGPFRPLAELVAGHGVGDRPPGDPGLVAEGLRTLRALAAPRPDDVLLMTDLHAGNVLAAAREPWLAIDPKPWIGDRAYDVTQHLLNDPARLRRDARGAWARMADLIGLDVDRVALWTFGRLAVEDWEARTPLARALARRLAP